MNWPLAFDVILVALMLWLAWRALHTNDLFHAVILFIVLGLLIALAWVRLQAPDAALAEAAIGAGLAGALLLATLARLETQRDEAVTAVNWLWSLLWLGLLIGIGLALLHIPAESEGLMPIVMDAMPQSGVEHPVTAVLLNFRAFDTWLELAVLLWAWLGQRGLGIERTLPLQTLSGEVLPSVVKLLWPLVLLVAAYLLWRGAFAPGGAFQSGAVLAAGLVMLILAQMGLKTPHITQRLLWVAGFWIFLAVGLVGGVQTASFMGYVPTQAGGLILLIEVAATLSIAFILASMLSGETNKTEAH